MRKFKEFEASVNMSLMFLHWKPECEAQRLVNVPHQREFEVFFLLIITNVWQSACYAFIRRSNQLVKVPPQCILDLNCEGSFELGIRSL